ncbi:ornithine cyclodeaminase family protein [Streptomyces sp. NPDC101062]|uniref:ornithine cyclodeaminase family protein n=1 Tax=unclassified Streptomyces TaxID=2593676 RepID=UPI0038111289
MIVIDDTAVRALYPMSRAIEDMRAAFLLYSSGRASQPRRVMTPGEGSGEVLAAMPAYLPPPAASGTPAPSGTPAAPGAPAAPGTGDVPGADLAGFGLKAIAVQPANPARGLDPHPGVVLLLDADTCAPEALVDATSITLIRTAAASAVATDLLAAPDADVLAVLGTGAQARSHVESLCLVRPCREIRIWGRTPGHARAFAEDCRKFLADGGRHPSVVTFPDAAEAAAGAGLICTVTAASEPVLDAAAVAPGAHINAVGAVFPSRRELTSALVARSTVFTDSRDSALAEAGDLLVPIREGLIGEEHLRAEIGEVLLGTVRGRTSAREITVFASLGLAVQDVVAARSVLRRARAEGAGTEVRLSADPYRRRTPR